MSLGLCDLISLLLIIDRKSGESSRACEKLMFAYHQHVSFFLFIVSTNPLFEVRTLGSLATVSSSRWSDLHMHEMDVKAWEQGVLSDWILEFREHLGRKYRKVSAFLFMVYLLDRLVPDSQYWLTKYYKLLWSICVC